MTYAIAPLVLAISLSAVGCRNACDDAVDHLEACGADPGVFAAGTCDARGECESECILASSCDVFRGQGADPLPIFRYMVCNQECRR
ncbi:hypothetical protein [Sorangium sp. So ce1335]|uniref:hypothetical protein n=1 Tax=Sorangium sp. So ce1335 TaxID=3133335 RepID=UPI003F5FAD41